MNKNDPQSQTRFTFINSLCKLHEGINKTVTDITDLKTRDKIINELDDHNFMWVELERTRLIAIYDER